jgi:hypothetical protein
MHENCNRCKHRLMFTSVDGPSVSINLCMAKPWTEDEVTGVTAWLDTRDFDSNDCPLFKDRRNDL